MLTGIGVEVQMVKGKPKADGGAGKKGSKVDAAAADEDMHRMEMCVGWIYEFFSRHRLEEAQDGAHPNAVALVRAILGRCRWRHRAPPVLPRCALPLRAVFCCALRSLTLCVPLACTIHPSLAALVKSAEKRFHISLSSLQAHSDPCSILQQLLDKGEVSASTRLISALGARSATNCLTRAGARRRCRVCACHSALGGVQFEQAFAEFDDQLEDFKSVVGEDLYADTLLQVMIQTTLQNLRAEGGKNNFEDFRQRY